MYLHTWGLPAALRAAGLMVVETPGWASRSHGALPSNPTVVWHHDASPPGDSPGALSWMISNYNVASAQIWINRAGVVHLVGAGMAWHAGQVLAGSQLYDNYHSIGIETDHTVNEDWPEALLHSLRLATAVILDKGGRSRTEFSFHKAICAPVGRKVDPHGLDLATERSHVSAISTNGGNSNPPTDPQPAEPFVAWPPAPYELGEIMEPGDKVNDGVRKLQRRLNDIIRFVGGSPLITVDGNYGPTTAMWVGWYQQTRNARVDNRVGPITWRSLWE